ncbi:MAG: glycosyltransferase [Candidatus Wildermuthbacteria bacterium]|nr:glycosyltransferase [Candidatus Wildermuthbacteria bacterium]
MTLSFIVPAYNEEKYISKCLQSLLNQKGISSFEVIVVDNNSNDATSEIVQRDFPLARLIHEPRQGMTKARNRGAKEAQGNILAFIDADSMIPDHWAKTALSYFSQDPRLVGISGPSRFYDLPMRYKFIEFVNFKILYPVIGEFLLKSVLKKGALWNGADIAVRKDAFERAGGFSEEIIMYGEDLDLARKLMKQGKVRFIQNMWVWSSARRLLKGNPIAEGFRYLFQYSWFFLTGKSKETSYKEIR